MARYYGTRSNDTAVGAAEQDFFYDFGLGQDVLIGGLKSDTFYLRVDDVADRVDGRDGSDTIDYSGADRAVRIDLTAGTVTATFHYNDVISYDATRLVAHVENVENATGSIYGDTIYGTDGKNTLDGNAGDDWLYGFDQDDTLIGGANADHLFGGNDDDTLIGGRGDDYINGGGGTDTVSYAELVPGSGYGLFANLTDHSFFGIAAHTVRVDLGGSNIETDMVVGVENLIGTASYDQVEGSAVANVIDGGDCDDLLLGHDGDDTLIGGNGIDVLVGGRGADHLVGDASDWVDYMATNELPPYDDPTGTVVINLTDPTQNTWWAAGDTYDGIENIVGSFFVDTITGDDNDNIIVDPSSSNTFYGLGGNDTFSGSAANGDRFYGGLDEDTVDYSGTRAHYPYGGNTAVDPSRSNVTVDLLNQSLNAGAATGDYFNSIEDIIGTRHDDTISGSVYDNVLIGYDGDDRLEGRGGVDTLLGGEGSDTAVFSGNFADYQFTTVQHVNADGHFERYLEVYDTHAWRDGIDYLFGVEHLEFHNTTVNTASVMDPLFHP